MDERKMKKIGFKMSLYMGLTLSLFLTITGVCSGMLKQVLSGNLPPQAMIGSFVSGYIISFIISMIIGVLIPMNKVTQNAIKNMGEGIKKRCVETLISDLIYTPIISAAMVAFAYMSNVRKGITGPPYIVMLIPSLIACLIVGYILIFIFQPMFMKKIMEKEGINMGQGPKP